MYIACSLVLGLVVRLGYLVRVMCCWVGDQDRIWVAPDYFWREMFRICKVT